MGPVAWQTVTELVCRIHADLDRSWSIAELAAEAGYQEHHLAKVFRAVVGQPPLQYLRRLRLERAAHQLESHPHRTIREVAADAGYAAPEAFCRAFVRAFRRTPVAFRAEGDPRGVPHLRRSPASRPAALGPAARRVTDVIGWAVPMSADPSGFADALAVLTAACPDAASGALGALAHPWGWASGSVPEFLGVARTPARPVPHPLLPIRVPERAWAVYRWTGPPWAVSDGIFWVIERELPARRERLGFAPTFTWLDDPRDPASALEVWVPVGSPV